MRLLTNPIKAGPLGLLVLVPLLAALCAPCLAQADDETEAEMLHVSIIPANNDIGASPPPPVLADLQNQSAPEEDSEEEGGKTLGLQIRADAMREAALSYGARGGLASRTFEIQRRLA